MTGSSPAAGGLLRIHKIISRSLGMSIQKCKEYLEQEGIPADEIRGFSLYVATMKWVTHAHHLSEDEIIFPRTKGVIEAPYERLKDDHKSISGMLASIDLCLAGKSSVDFAELCRVLEEFNKLWIAHIAIEENTFTHENLNSVIDIKEQLELTDKISGHGIKNSGPGPLALPFLIYNLEGDDRKLFMMTLPWIARKILVPVAWRKQWSPMKPFLYK